MSASRTVANAVASVLELAPRHGEVSIVRLVWAVGESRSRPVSIEMAELPPGVCGQWRQYGDRDVFLILRGGLGWMRQPDTHSDREWILRDRTGDTET